MVLSSGAAINAGVWRQCAPLLLAFASVTPARAEEGPRRVSLAEARAAAVRVGPEVLLAAEREAVTQTQVEIAGALANPTLSLGTARLTARVQAGMSLPLSLFGQRSTAVSAARADSDVARLDRAIVRLDARWFATRAWLDLWESQERVRLLLTAAGDADSLAKTAHERFSSGVAARVDEVRTSAERARARADATAAQTGVAGAAARLAVWLGTADVYLEASGPPDFLAPPAEALASARLAAHPTLQRDHAQEAAAASHLRAEGRQRWPVVTAQVSVAQGDPTVPGTDVIGSLSFEAPVLNLRGGAIARARAEKSLSETTTEVDRRRLSAELADAYAQARAAGTRAESFERDVLPALDEAHRMTVEGYRDGRIDLLRVLESQRAVLDARITAVEARAAAGRALADVERARGAVDGGDERAP